METKQENVKFYEALKQPYFQNKVKNCKVSQGAIYSRWKSINCPDISDTLVEILCKDSRTEFHQAYLVSEFNNGNAKTNLTDLTKQYCKTEECKQWIAEFRKETGCKSLLLCRLEYLLAMHYIDNERYWELRDDSTHSIYTQLGYPAIPSDYVSKLVES